MSDEHPRIHPESEVARAEQEQLDEVWIALEDGELEEAIDLAESLAQEYPRDGDVALARAATYYEAGLAGQTLEEIERAGQLGTTDDVLRRWYEAAARYYLWDFDGAREELEALVREDQEFGEAWLLIAQVCEMQEDQVGARRGYDRAFALQPDRFHRPTRIDDDTMEEVVSKARAALPEEFRHALDEVAVVWRDVPDAEMAVEESATSDPLPPDLLGLFVGADRLDRSVFNPVEQSGVIFLFKKNLERVCPNVEFLAAEVRTTLWHELAHYLGFEEEDMADLGLD